MAKKLKGAEMKNSREGVVREENRKNILRP
jgi:hypothetical protein